MTAPAPPALKARPQTANTLILTAVITTVFSYALMQTVAIPALSLLTRELDTTPTWSAWILSAFLLSSAVLTPILSRLGDLYGKRRIMTGVLIAYAIGMLGAAAAQDVGQLIAARVVQGSALAVVPVSLAIMRETLPRERVPYAMGLVSGTVGAGSGAGVVVGGLLTDHLSWRYLFVLGAVLATVSLLMVLRWVPADHRRETGTLDVPGAILLGLSLVAVLLALTQGPAWGWTSAPVLGLFALGALLLAALVVVERRTDDPLIDIGELTDRSVAVAHVGALLFGTGSYFFFLALPLFAQQTPGPDGAGFGATITMAGLLMLPGMLTAIPGGAGVGPISTAFGPRWALAGGFLLFSLGAVLIALAHSAEWQHAVFYGIVGLGSGLIMGALPSVIADAVPPERTGTAIGINNIIRTVGSVVGSQLAAGVITSLSPAGADYVPDTAFTTIFWLSAAVTVLGAALAPLAVQRTAPISRSTVTG